MYKLYSIVVLVLLSHLTACAPAEGEMLSDEASKLVSFKMENAVTPFFGRVAELSELEWKHADNRLAVISGQKGVGKSELARKYAENFKKDSSTVWINSETTSKSFSEIYELASTLGITTEGKKKLAILREVFAYFDNQKVLFVFDNAPDSNALLMYLPRILGNTKNIYVILTSRSENWSKDYSMLKLGTFSKPESVEYLKSALTQKVTDAKYEELAEALKYLPVALKRSSDYINEQSKLGSYTVDDFIDEMKGKKVTTTTTTTQASIPGEDDSAEDLLSQLEEESVKFSQKVAQEATKAWQTVSQGAEHAWEKVSSGAAHTGETIVSGAKQAGREVAKAAESVKSWFG